SCDDTTGRIAMPQREYDPHATYRIGLSLRITGQSDAWRPALEVYETEKALVIRAELAGINEDHLRVVLDDDTVTIHGKRLPEARGESDVPEQRSYHEMGIPYGPFRARVALPFPVVRGAVEANYEHGVLTILLPRAERVRIHATPPGTAVAVGASEDDTIPGAMGKDSE
ncbi:MAG: Hsp20/alpha crystallin family protein, partial [Thermomicrobiales bacterium]